MHTVKTRVVDSRSEQSDRRRSRSATGVALECAEGAKSTMACYERRGGWLGPRRDERNARSHATNGRTDPRASSAMSREQDGQQVGDRRARPNQKPVKRTESSSARRLCEPTTTLTTPSSSNCDHSRYSGRTSLRLDEGARCSTSRLPTHAAHKPFPRSSEFTAQLTKPPRYSPEPCRLLRAACLERETQHPEAHGSAAALQRKRPS